MTYNGAQLVPYIDGVAVTPFPASCAGATSLGNNSVTLGGFDGSVKVSASIDEFRISTATRSADWILTEYRNQTRPQRSLRWDHR